MIVKGEIERRYAPVVFDINRETYLKIMGVNFHRANKMGPAV